MNNENVLFSIAMPSYSQITKVDPNGNSEVIYTCGNNQAIKFVMVFIVIVVFVVLAIRIVFFAIHKIKKRNKIIVCRCLCFFTDVKYDKERLYRKGIK